MVFQLKRSHRKRAIVGKLNSPGWLAGYALRIAKVTGWGYREIMEELPFAAGLQIIHADDYSKGIERTWTRNECAGSFDSLAIIEEAFSKL